MGIIEDEIDKATDSSLARPDNELVIKILQYLLENPDQSQNAVNAIMQRLINPDVKVQMLTLYLIDKWMKKLSNNFVKEVENKKFFNWFILLLNDSNSVEQIIKKVLQLIQQWGVTYEDDLNHPLFNQVYTALKGRRNDFPNEDEVRAKLKKSNKKTPTKSSEYKEQVSEVKALTHSPLDEVPVQDRTYDKKSKKHKKKHHKKKKKVALNDAQKALK